MTEEWRDVEGFNGIYSVSNLGRVRRNTSAITYFTLSGTSRIGGGM